MLNTTLFGFLLLSRGIGNVLSTPISTSLFQGGGNGPNAPKVGFDVDGGKYQKMIVYVGTCFAGAAVMSAVGWSVDKRRRQ
jgi:MFS transporter, MCT family, solute carrier family 16 (monocarboxylic acid transporters), member 10